MTVQSGSTQFGGEVREAAIELERKGKRVIKPNPFEDFSHTDVDEGPDETESVQGAASKEQQRRGDRRQQQVEATGKTVGRPGLCS